LILDIGRSGWASMNLDINFVFEIHAVVMKFLSEVVPFLFADSQRLRNIIMTKNRAMKPSSIRGDLLSAGLLLHQVTQNGPSI